jgi:hypothetical protein
VEIIDLALRLSEMCFPVDGPDAAAGISVSSADSVAGVRT